MTILPHLPRILTLSLSLSLLGLLLISSGCSTQGPSALVDSSQYAVTCVGVLPPAAAPGHNGTEAEKKEMEVGLFVLNEAMEDLFSGNSEIRLVTDSKLSGMKDLPAQPLARATMVADRLSCNAVLETTLHRYKDRIGGKLTAQEPASISFDYRLLAIPSGTVLCRGAFDQAQHSVMENLFNPAGTNRAFTWLTAEEMMHQGVELRLADCPYLVADEY